MQFTVVVGEKWLQHFKSGTKTGLSLSLSPPLSLSLSLSCLSVSDLVNNEEKRSLICDFLTEVLWGGGG